MKLVEFSDADNDLIFQTAAARNSTNRKASNSDAAVDISLSLVADQIGAAGELAVAKFFGFHWGGRLFSWDEWLIARRTVSDVGSFEVKSSKHPKCRLFIPCYQVDSAKRNSPYILVKPSGRGNNPLTKISRFTQAEIKGWALGSEILELGLVEAHRAGRDCYYLHSNHLRSIDTMVY